jgi:ATP-binding cassette subfamily C protein
MKMDFAFSERNHTRPGAMASQFLRDFASFAGRRGAVAVVLVGLGALLEALSLVVIVPLLGLAIGSDVGSGKIGRATAVVFHVFGLEQPAGRLALLLGVFAILIVVRALILSIRDSQVAELQTSFVEALRLRIAERLVTAQWDQIVKLRHSRITQLMSSEIQRIGDMTQLILRSAVLSAMLMAQFVLVLLLAPLFAALAITFLLAGTLVFLPFVRRAHALGTLMTTANLSLLDATSQFLGGLKLAMSQNLQIQFIKEFRQSLHDLAVRQVDYSRQQSNVRNTLSILTGVAAALLVLIGFIGFHLPAATLIALVVVIARMINPLGQIQQDLQNFVHFLPAYKKAKEFEREFATVALRDPEQTLAYPLPEGVITFENVSYRYTSDDGHDAAVNGVQNVNIVLRPSEVIGITGPSGSGKTTFADLLVGLFPPQEGRIAVAGRTLEGATLTAWRNSVSYISQDPFLFHDTIRNNITWASPHPTEEAIWGALTVAGAAKFIRGLESGLDTVVGERGSLVSGGERQRIALARAILRKPRLLVLDEATNAIDVPSEQEILRGLRDLLDRPTIIVIAHRAETLSFCERLFRFEAGHCEGVDTSG